jgi:hypothetical protein
MAPTTSQLARLGKPNAVASVSRHPVNLREIHGKLRAAMVTVGRIVVFVRHKSIIRTLRRTGRDR